MDYQEIFPISKEEAECNFNSGDLDSIRLTMVRISFYEQDRIWAETKIISYCSHWHTDIRRVAATCLGHLARVHGMISKNLVLPILWEMLFDSDPTIVGHAEDAISDIKIFVKN